MGRGPEFKTEYCQSLIAHMADGLSYRSFAGTIDQSYQTLYNWESRYPEWKDAKEVAFAKCELYWEKIGRDNILNESFGGGVSRSLNATVWTFNMRNRFGWTNESADDKGEGDKKPLRLAYRLDDEGAK